ncbi:hypothetical protein MY11210_002361 [Beauveria gryllotalpidicola]
MPYPHANVAPDLGRRRPTARATLKRIAVSLLRFGVADQDGVGLLSENDIYYHVLGDVAVAAGAVLKWLFVAPEFLHLALATVESLGLPPSMVVVFDPPGLDAYRGTQASLSNIIDGVDEASSRNTNEEKDATTREAFRFFTSGSTGSAKAATISHRASAVRVDFVAAMPLLDKPFLLVIGMFHVSGALVHMRACLGGYLSA